MIVELDDLLKIAPTKPENNPFVLGNFAPVTDEQTLSEFEVIGEIPAQINGTLLRAGPNPVSVGLTHHWFSGAGMIHGITLENGKALGYRNRWVRSEELQLKSDKKAATLLPNRLPGQGVGNVNIVSHAGQILALSELGYPFAMDEALNTQGEFDYAGGLPGSMTAHPKIDGKTGEMIFFGYNTTAPYLRYHLANKQGELIRSVDIDLPRGVMMHDFGVTASRVVFMDFAVVGELNDLPYRWDDEHQCRLGIMDRNSETDSVKWIDIDPCFVFHPLNCYDDGDNIIMDVVRYESMFRQTPNPEEKGGSPLVRWTINVAQGTLSEQVICPRSQEFPRVNPNFECHPHRYGYGVEFGGQHGFGGLLKHDLQQGETTSHDVGDNCAAGEPIFVPYGDAEDEGYLLSVVYNGDTQLSELRIIDAQNFTAPAVAIVKLGARVPFGFHGNFVPKA